MEGFDDGSSLGFDDGCCIEVKLGLAVGRLVGTWDRVGLCVGLGDGGRPVGIGVGFDTCSVALLVGLTEDGDGSLVAIVAVVGATMGACVEHAG